MTQDFSKKMTIVLREDLASWQLTNTIGHIAAYLGNKIQEPFDTGENFATKDGLTIPRNSQFAIVALKASAEDLKNLSSQIPNSGLSWIVYVQEMIDMIDDEELARSLSQVESEKLNILGIGLFGSKDELKNITGNLKLWKQCVEVWTVYLGKRKPLQPVRLTAVFSGCVGIANGVVSGPELHEDQVHLVLGGRTNECGAADDHHRDDRVAVGDQALRELVTVAVFLGTSAVGV